METSLYVAVVLSTIVYALVVLLYRLCLRGKATVDTQTSLSFSILKPLAGADDDLEDNLNSFAKLEGASFEIILGVASRTDAAYPVALRFMESHPHVRTSLLVTNPDNALNPKVAQLMDLERIADGDIIVISDSNVRVAPDYLLHLGKALSEPDTHLVSTLVRGEGEADLGSAMENTIQRTHVAPGVCAGYMLTDKAISIGKSMAMHRSALELVGGFAPLADTLAEDHVMGQVFDRAGFGVKVLPYFVTNRNSRCTLARSMERHSRWAKIRRQLEPVGFVFEPLLTPIVPAAITAAVLQTQTSALVLVLVMALQAVGAHLMVRAQGVEPGWTTAPMEWMRSVLLFGCWLHAWVSRSVNWRGHKLTIGAGTVIERPAALVTGDLTAGALAPTAKVEGPVLY